MVLKLKIRLMGVLFLGFISQCLLAQNSNLPGVTLEEFFSAAIEFSPTLQIASENLNISSARKKAANGQLLPQLNAGANVSDNNAVQFNRTQNFVGERYFLALSQTLFNWQQFAARKQANLLEDQSEEEYYYQLAVLLTDVAERYFGDIPTNGSRSSTAGAATTSSDGGQNDLFSFSSSSSFTRSDSVTYSTSLNKITLMPTPHAMMARAPYN